MEIVFCAADTGEPYIELALSHSLCPMEEDGSCQPWWFWEVADRWCAREWPEGAFGNVWRRVRSSQPGRVCYWRLMSRERPAVPPSLLPCTRILPRPLTPTRTETTGLYFIYFFGFVFFFFNGQENKGFEKLSHLPRVTELGVFGGTGRWPWVYLTLGFSSKGQIQLDPLGQFRHLTKASETIKTLFI